MGALMGALTNEQQAELWGIATSPLRQTSGANGVPLSGPLAYNVDSIGVRQPQPSVPLMYPNQPPVIRHGDPNPPTPTDNSRTVSEMNNKPAALPARKPKKPDVSNPSSVQQPGVADPQPPQSEVPFNPPAITDAPIEGGTVKDNRTAIGSNRPYGAGAQPADGAQEQKPVDRYQSIYGALFGNEPYERGKKWISYMEQGMQSPVNDNSMLQRNVANEIALLKAEQDKTLGQKQLDMQNRMYKNDNAEVRYKKMALFDQRKSLLDKWEKGKFLGDDEKVTQDFFNNLANIDQILHDEYGVDTRLLDYPSTNPGGFSTQFKRDVTEPTNTALHLSNWMKSIYDQVQRDPNWLNSPEGTEAFDKLGEYAILQEAQSKGAIADAEKVRIQVETMSPTERRMYNNNIRLFLICNQAAQALAQNNKLDHSTLASIQQWDKLMNGVGDYDDDESRDGAKTKRQSRDEYFNEMRKAVKSPSKYLGKKGGGYIADTILGVYAALQNAGQNIPVELQAAVTSMKNGMDMYQQYLMQSAPTNKKLIWNVASRVFDNARQKSEYWNRVGGHRYGFGTGHLWNPSNPQFADWLGRWQEAYGEVDPILGTGFTTSRSSPKPTHLGNPTAGNYGANYNAR